MNLTTLQTFVTVAEEGSFSRAADLLHLAQPAVSQQIKRLERQAGADLFHRSTRRVELTAAGAALLPRARTILADVAAAETELRLLQQGRTGRVSVGFVGTATYDLLPRLARTVRADLPGVDLEVYGERLSPALEHDVRERRLDIAFMRAPTAEPGLRTFPVRSERLVAALPAEYPPDLRLADLRDEVFITHPSGHRSVMFDAVMRACRDVGFTPAEVVEVRETATLVAFVAAGMGVALVPEPVRSLALDGVAYRALPDLGQRTELVVATRADDESATVAQVVAAASRSVRP